MESSRFFVSGIRYLDLRSTQNIGPYTLDLGKRAGALEFQVGLGVWSLVIHFFWLPCASNTVAVQGRGRGTALRGMNYLLPTGSFLTGE